MSNPEPKVEHYEGRGIRSEGRGIRSCPIFPELRAILDDAFEIFGDKSEYVVAVPQYRTAANTAMGWKNANLRSEMTRLLQVLQHLDRDRRNPADYSKSKKGLSPWTV